jgi:hypothetical protein
MAERIKIITVAMTEMGMATRISNLLPVVDCYARLAMSRIFEIAFRLYSLPV